MMMYSICRHNAIRRSQSLIFSSIASPTFLISSLSSAMRFHSSAVDSLKENGDESNIEDHDIKSSRIITSRILASGACIARHGRPIPENVNLDDLSKKLLLSLQKQQESKKIPSKESLSVDRSQGRKLVDSVSNIRRIMPLNAKAAASSSAPGKNNNNANNKRSISPKKDQSPQHAVDNLLLVTVQLKQLEGKCCCEEDERNVVVFPDSTIVVWGPSCVEEDCDVIADYLFYGQFGGISTTKTAISIPVPDNVEMEKINYQFVQEQEEQENINLVDDEIEQINASVNRNNNDKVATKVENQQGSGNDIDEDNDLPTAELHEPGSVEIEDGVVTIYGPFSASTKSHYNCYPARLSFDHEINNNNILKNNNNNNAEDDDSFALEMLPIAMAVAQSARVDAIDHFVVAKLARDVRVWQKDLAFKGTLGQRFTLRDLRRSKAIVLGVMEEVSFALDMETSATSKLLRIANDLKKFRESYDKVADHFELERRLEALDSRVEAIDHSLVYLHEERHSVMSEQMTILIVVLIAMEIVVAVIEM